MIPESVIKASVLKAVSIESPAAGINRQFDGGTFQVFATVAPGTHFSEGIRFVVYQNGGTKSFDSHKDVLRVLKAAPGTATGDAIRQWFAFYHDRHHQGVSAKHQPLPIADSHSGDRAITQGAQVYGAASS